MTSTAPTFSQIKAQVAAIRQKVPNARTIGIQTTGRWIGALTHSADGETYRIVQCDSPLAVRIALRHHENPETINVVVTSLKESELGDDILVRLPKRRLFSLDRWQIVKSLFQAQSIDPRIMGHRWIAEYLIEWKPSGGYPPVTSGFLDAETVWLILLNQGIGLTSDSSDTNDTAHPDLVSILKWSTNAEHVKQYQSISNEFRIAITNWLTSSAGQNARTIQTILDCIAVNEHPDAISIGLAGTVVFHPEGKGKLERAMGKMEERYFAGQSPAVDVMNKWGKAALEVLQSQLETPQQHRLLQRADEILREVGAETFAYLSPFSPIGFEQRLVAFGKALTNTLQKRNAKALSNLVKAQCQVLDHGQADAKHEQRRLERIKMATRLARWLVNLTQEKDQFTQPRSLSEAIRYQLTEGSFIDWARLVIRSGEPLEELSKAYSELFQAVTTLQEQQAYQFATLLQNWTELGSTHQDIIPIENILESSVAPLAAHAPVLLIVMDGMSIAVCRELLTSITRKNHWICLAQEQQTSALMAGLATIPSTTDISRTSLLCGKLQSGTQSREKSGFAAHPSLLKYCQRDYPPILFHKASLREQDDAGLADDVRQAISSSQHRVVGVVINAVDDYLLKGEQLDLRWSQDDIKVLATLLHEARLSQRLVIFVSDHGHILEHQTTYQKNKGGERWRYETEALEKGELKIQGARVIVPESQTLIAAWTEKLRYGMKKNGYHGGINPQEMVIPVAVLSSTQSYPAGWNEAPVDTPVWWDEPINQIDDTTQTSAIYQSTEQANFGPLFNLLKQQSEEIEDTRQNVLWIDTLLASPIYIQQKELAGRSAPSDQIVSTILIALNRSGNKITLHALTRTINCPPTQTHNLLITIQRVLNVDGYPVITYDQLSESVELNYDLLGQQFGFDS